MKFPWANAEKLEEAGFVLLGVPDESGSSAERKGASQAPKRVREVAQRREVFERHGSTSTAQPGFSGLEVKIFDYGNIEKSKVAALVEKLVRKDKIPITVGGDHSITAEVLKGIDAAERRVSVAYFDSHPDFICSTKRYYGSVVCDIMDYKNIAFDRSIEIGIRNPEPEELVNIRRENLETISALQVAEHGPNWVASCIKKRVRGSVYVSIDMDVLDPAFAPGVSTPSPFGLSSTDLLLILSKIMKLGIAGMDVMEVCPPYDVNDATSHLAARLIVEAVSCTGG
jgi:agmatinase